MTQAGGESSPDSRSFQSTRSACAIIRQARESGHFGNSRLIAVSNWESDRSQAMGTDLRDSRDRPKPADYRDMSDTELVAAVESDLEAFGELIRRHQDFVYGAALRVVRNPVLAQDVAQDAFVRAYKALPDFRGQAAVRSWLYRIATNLALNAVQRRKEYPAETLPEAPSTSGPEGDAERGQMAEDLRAAIDKLPDDLRIPLVMREYGGMAYQDIADDLGIPLNTVRTRILRARRSLREAMEEWQ